MRASALPLDGRLRCADRYIGRAAVLPGGDDLRVAAVQAGLHDRPRWASLRTTDLRRASDLARPLMAVPGPVTSATSAGCNALIRDQRAACVTSAAEIIAFTLS